jgi:TRAP-type C4-dicarboxylate transport system permease small subunit
MFERILGRITRVAEFIAAMGLAAIFVIFLLQIFTRYAPKIAWIVPISPIHDWMMALEPIGWTVNLISLLWVWLIFFGCAFFVREKDHVAFDVFYQALAPSWQRYLALTTAAIMIAVMLYSFGPTWDAILGSRLMDLKKIQTLRIPITGDKIPIKWLFASYVMLMAVLTLRYVWRAIALVRTPSSPDETTPPPRSQSGKGGA